MTEPPTCCRKHWSEHPGQQTYALLTADGKVLMNPPNLHMMVCSTCGNKRCPKATDCLLQCTNSNDPGQPDSIYG